MTSVSKKTFRKIKEVKAFYRFVHKYKLREEAYKTLLKVYIKTLENKPS